ncbi:17326_t:CDS:2, partial [Gigaspora rosea]
GLRAQTRAVLEMKLDDIKLLMLSILTSSLSPKEKTPKMDSTKKLTFAKVANNLLKENKNVKEYDEEEHNEEFYDAQDTEVLDKFTTMFNQADSNPDKPDVVLVDMVLEHIGLTYVLRPFDMSAKVILKSFSVVNKISNTSSEFKHLAASEGYGNA